MIEQVSVTISGMLDVEIPDGTNLESMEPREYSDFVSEYIDWHNALNLLDTEIEPV